MLAGPGPTDDADDRRRRGSNLPRGNMKAGTFDCAYCGRQFPDTDRTREHVVPAALGGATEPHNPFLIDVCSKCNSACGRHVDGSFIRNWLVSNNRAENSRTFVDLAAHPAIPLVYMGPLEAAPRVGSRVCELWLGPTGDTIYHFHEPYEAESPTTVGPPTHLPKRDLDPGFVFLFVRASNPKWHPCIIYSTLAQFDRATIYLANGPVPEIARFQAIPEELIKVRDQLKQASGQMHHVQLAMKVDFGDRFLAKLALGFGTLCLGPSYIGSAYAVLLRNFLWCRDPTARQQMPVHGTAFLGDIDPQLASLLSVPFGHSFTLLPVGNKLALFASFYGSTTGLICVTDDPAIAAQVTGGRVYVVVPGFRAAIGPMTLAAFVEDYHGESPRPTALTTLIARIAARPPLPPFDLPPGDREAQLKNAVRKHAHALWEARGRPLGDDHADWFEARRALGIPETMNV